MSDVPRRLLIVEDDRDFSDTIVELIQTELADVPLTVDQVTTLAETQDATSAYAPYHTYLVDYLLPDGTGVEFTRQLRTEGIHSPVILLTGLNDTQTVLAAMKAGATDYLVKDESLAARLPASVRQALDQEQREEKRRGVEEALRNDAERLFDIVATQYDVVSADLDRDAIMSLVVERCQKLTHARGAMVHLVEESTIVCAAASGTRVPEVGQRDPLAGSFLEQCVLTGEMLRCDDTEIDSSHGLGAWRQTGIRSVISVPVNSEGQVLGVLTVVSPEPHAFDDRDIYTLLLMSGSMAAVTSRALEFAAKQALVERLQEREERLNRIIETSAQGILLVDAQGQVTFANKVLHSLAGADDTELVGRACNTIPWKLSTLNGEAIALRDYPYMRVMRSGEPVSGLECSFTSIDGRELVGSINAAPLRDTTGAVTGVVISAADITERKRAEEELSRARDSLAARVEELEHRTRELTLVSEMGELLQACRSTEEAYRVLNKSVQELFPDEAGALSIIEGATNLVETIATWGGGNPSTGIFTPDDCWALRRGRIHIVQDTNADPLCQHLTHPLPFGYICIPLIAQRETLGVLYLGDHSGRGLLTTTRQQLARTVGEQISLALANLRLQQKLLHQSIRDPLTGLFNRRYMQESLEREIKRVQRNGLPLSIIMLDIDHFKLFNDTYGHEAGDTLLREVGESLRKQIRSGDIACRYGGEEFTLILPEASLDNAMRKAEQIREAVKDLHVQHRRQPLGTITLSLGVAVLPDHGITGDSLLSVADAALYHAKESGRDRVVAGAQSFQTSTRM